MMGLVQGTVPSLHRLASEEPHGGPRFREAGAAGGGPRQGHRQLRGKREDQLRRPAPRGARPRPHPARVQAAGHRGPRGAPQAAGRHPGDQTRRRAAGPPSRPVGALRGRRGLLPRHPDEWRRTALLRTTVARDRVIRRRARVGTPPGRPGEVRPGARPRVLPLRGRAGERRGRPGDRVPQDGIGRLAREGRPGTRKGRAAARGGKSEAVRHAWGGSSRLLPASRGSLLSGGKPSGIDQRDQVGHRACERGNA